MTAHDLHPSFARVTWRDRLVSCLYDNGFCYGARRIAVAHAEAHGTVRGLWVFEGFLSDELRAEVIVAEGIAGELKGKETTR